MKMIRVYSGDDQQSHFEELPLMLTDAQYGQLTSPMTVKHVIFGEIEEPKEVSWHNPPYPQYIIMLKGAMEIEVGSGAKKIFYQGDILLAEDTTGQGHITRALSDGVRQYIAIRI